MFWVISIGICSDEGSDFEAALIALQIGPGGKGYYQEAFSEVTKSKLLVVPNGSYR